MSAASPTISGRGTADRSHATPAAVATVITAGVLLVWAATYLPWLGLLDLLLEEPRRALVTRAMLETGDFWVPQVGGEVYTAKPPLFNWLMAASARLHGGLDAWSARMPSAVSIAALTLVMLWGARRWLRPWALVFFAAALLLAPQFLAKGRLAEIEAAFALLVAASLWSWLLLYARNATGWRLWVPPLTLVALAYLTKREPAVVFFYLTVGSFLLLQRQGRLLLQPGHFAAAALAAALVGVWLAMMAAEVGWRALWESLQHEVIARGLSQQGWAEIATHIISYPWELAGALLPFSLLLPLVADRVIRQEMTLRFGPAFLFAAVAVLANLPVYWLRGDVSVRYFLPMFPFVLLIAAMIFDVLTDPTRRPGRWVLHYLLAVRTFVLVIAAVLTVLLLASAAIPWVDPERNVLLPALFTGALAIFGAAVLWRVPQWARFRPMPALLVLFTTTMLLFAALHINALLPEKVRRIAEDRNAPLIAEQVRGLAGDDATVLAFDVPWALWYYGSQAPLQPLPIDGPLPSAAWILVHARSQDLLAAREIPVSARARFRYGRDDILLLQVSTDSEAVDSDD